MKGGGEQPWSQDMMELELELRLGGLKRKPESATESESESESGPRGKERERESRARMRLSEEPHGGVDQTRGWRRRGSKPERLSLRGRSSQPSLFLAIRDVRSGMHLLLLIALCVVCCIADAGLALLRCSPDSILQSRLHYTSLLDTRYSTRHSTRYAIE